MKLSDVIENIKKGNPVYRLRIYHPEGYSKDVEYISIADTLYCKKNVQKQEDDVIIKIADKEFNVTEFSRIINQYKGSDIEAYLLNKIIKIEF